MERSREGEKRKGVGKRNRGRGGKRVGGRASEMDKGKGKEKRR